MRVLGTPGNLLLVTAQRDGSVSLLGGGDGDSFVELDSASDADLINPTALEPVPLANGLFEVYVTNAGDSRPIVLSLRLDVGLSPGVNPFAPAVVLTLGLPPETSSVPTDPPSEILFSFQIAQGELLVFPGDTATLGTLGDEDLIVPFGELLLTGLVAPPDPGGEDAEEEEKDGPEADATPTLQEFLTGAAEALERRRPPGNGQGAVVAVVFVPWTVTGWAEMLFRYIGDLLERVDRAPVPAIAAEQIDAVGMRQEDAPVFEIDPAAPAWSSEEGVARGSPPQRETDHEGAVLESVLATVTLTGVTHLVRGRKSRRRALRRRGYPRRGGQ
jgi:hypothetical protein